MSITVAVLREDAPAERRVALVPEVAQTLVKDGFKVLIEAGAGQAARYSDAMYLEAGAEIVSRAAAVAQANIIAAVQRPAPEVLQSLTQGQVLLGLLDARADEVGLQALATQGVHPLSLDLLPRQLSRAQTMDALTSQASFAGYRAAVLAANTFERYLPMMITAAGSAKPATVLVLGAGVAGLQAIGTARRLGAQVTGYDVRPEAQEEVKSLGAKFLTTSVTSTNEGGYARALDEDETARQQAELSDKIAQFDIVITTAQVPGRKPPLLVTDDTVAKMRPGSVLVDLAASSLGGNVSGSVPYDTVRTAGGVTIIGAPDLPSQMANGASAAYARNIAAVIQAFTPDAAITLDPTDEVIDALWIRDPHTTDPHEEVDPSQAELEAIDAAPGKDA